MNFLRLPDPLLAVLYEDQEILAVDKPYGINSHTNDSKLGNEDLIHDGLIEIFEKQFSQKLHIVHRLDQTTTGVIIFAKSEDARKRYADFFRNRQVKKTYWFLTAGNRKNDAPFTIDTEIAHKGKDLEAKTNFSLLKRVGHFSLWQANPLTGRNHQIRIHGQVAGLSLLGDAKYEGAQFPFLCLHNHKIEFPNGLVITSTAPPYFDDLKILQNRALAQLFFETDRRMRLFSSRIDQCLRLVHNKELGYTVDRFGKAILLSVYKENWTDTDRDIFVRYSEQMKLPIFVRMMLNRGKDPVAKTDFTIGSEPTEIEWIAREDDIGYEIRSNSGLSFGLFLDQRLQRNWVRQNVEGMTVLNLFSYTCGFSAAAALGGAKSVTSVDTNKNVLNWGRKNFEVNGLSTEAHPFLCRDGLTYLDQCANKGTKFDLIICDPPSFSRGEKGVFKIEQSLEALLTKCMKLMTHNGSVLFSTNYENFYVDDIRRAILKVQKELKIKDLAISSVQSALDFELPEKKPILKSFLIRRAN